MRSCLAALSLTALAFAASAAATPPSIEDFARDGDFHVEEARLSPTGEYVALTVPLGDRTGIMTLRMSDFSRVGAMQAGRNVHLGNIDWIDSERLIYARGEKFGVLEPIVWTGELFGVDVDGENNAALIGFRAGTDADKGTGTRVRRREAEWVAATLIEPRKDDPTEVFVSTFKMNEAEIPFTQVDRLDVRNGRRIKVASAPVTSASFTLDHDQQVRFALGSDIRNDSKLYYRADDDTDWILFNDEATSHRSMHPIGFSSDNAVAYLIAEETTGPDSVQAMDVATRAMREVARDAVADPGEVLYSPFDDAPIGVMVSPGLPKPLYFDPASDAAKLHRTLQNSFPGQTVRLRRVASDGESSLFTVSGDRNSGEVYAFNVKTKKARFLAAADATIDPATLGHKQPVAFDARDGTRIHGYLTLPPGSEGKNLPMVVLPHGGPFGVYDSWDYDAEAQLLATRGYAVLQPNFRGSGSYGRAFREAGERQWGRLMQDDVTDATRWAIAQGIADATRICIHGSSYGGYAALMGVAREPELYRCASGNVGVYDLRTMQAAGDIADKTSGRNYLRDVMDNDRLDADSPVNLADRIHVPVLLSAGADDERAPPIHTERMRDALARAGVQVKTKIYPGEGHGYFLATNRADYYTRLLAFLDQNIGKGLAAAPATAPGGD